METSLILDSSNNRVNATVQGRQENNLSASPLGKTGTGEVGEKVIVIGPVAMSGSFDIPAFDYQGFTYVGSTNNVATQVFKSGGSGGTTVATLIFTYVAAGTADNDKIASITRS